MPTEYDQNREQPRTDFPDNSPLGRDPGPAPEPEPDETPNEEPQGDPTPDGNDPNPDGGGISLSQDEYETLVDDQQSLRTIMSNPKLAQLVYDHIKNDGVEPVQDPAPTGNNQQGGNVDPALLNRLQSLEEIVQEGSRQLQESQRMVAQLTLQAFERENPDFGRVKTQVLTRMRNHPTLSLKEATELVMAEQGTREAARNGRQSQQTRTETVEGKQAGQMPVDTSDPLADVAKKISDAKSTDDAFDIALAAAVQKHSA